MLHARVHGVMKRFWQACCSLSCTIRAQNNNNNDNDNKTSTAQTPGLSTGLSTGPFHLLEPGRPKNPLHSLVEAIPEAQVLERRRERSVVQEPGRKASLEVKLRQPDASVEQPVARTGEGGTHAGIGVG